MGAGELSGKIRDLEKEKVKQTAQSQMEALKQMYMTDKLALEMALEKTQGLEEQAISQKGSIDFPLVRTVTTQQSNLLPIVLIGAGYFLFFKGR